MRKKILLLVGMSSILAPIAGCKNNIKDPDKWDLSTEDMQNADELAAPTYKINYQNNTITYVFHLGNEGIIKDSVNKEDILITDKSKLTSSDVNGKFFHKDAIVNAEVVTSKHNLGATNGDSTIEIETPYNEESDPMLIIDKSVSTLGEYFICPAFDVDNKALNMDINDYSSKIIEQDYTAEIKGIINIASSIAMIVIGMGSENPATAVSGVTSLLNTMFGMFGSEVSNAKLLKEIYIIQAQLKEVIGKLDNIEKTLN